jgi:hypothetical protein
LTSIYPEAYSSIIQKNLITFYEAVVAGICGLILAQISAPTQFKPLTNRTLDYPGTTIPTIINITNNIPQIKFSPIEHKLTWTPFRQAQIAMIREDAKAEMPTKNQTSN